VAAKLTMLKSIIKSQRIIGIELVEFVKKTTSIPEISTLADKSYQELIDLVIARVHQ
jgi:hypothetical protein